MEQKTEKMYRTLQTGMQAAAELPITKQLLDDSKDLLIRDAINAFQSVDPARRLDGTGALNFVAALSENRKLFDALERKIKDGERQQKQLETVAATAH